MKLRDLLNDPPRLHQDGAGETVSWGLLEEVLHFIEGEVQPGAATLETGAGLSTILFALVGADHTCITPNGAEVERIAAYCREHGIATDGLRFHVAGSEAVLPQLEPTPLALVLIDGRHAFPTPFIDWYYTAERLKVGGVLIVDDTQLWTGAVLRDFLLTEPEWALRAEFSTRAVAFTKLRAGSHRKEWNDQPYVVRNSTEYEGRDIVALTERVAQLEREHANAAAYARQLEARLRDTPALAKLLARRSLDRLRRRKAPRP
jgi:hypothetical protein